MQRQEGSEGSPSGVLGKSSIIVVNKTGIWVEDDVFQDGAELDGVENIWLLLA
jgi:hypothetical protein